MADKNSSRNWRLVRLRDSKGEKGKKVYSYDGYLDGEPHRAPLPPRIPDTFGSRPYPTPTMLQLPHWKDDSHSYLPRKLLISGLSPFTTEDHVHTHFSRHGDIRRVHLYQDARSGSSMGMATLTFDGKVGGARWRECPAIRACERENGHLLLGSKMTVMVDGNGSKGRQATQKRTEETQKLEEAYRNDRWKSTVPETGDRPASLSASAREDENGSKEKDNGQEWPSPSKANSQGIIGRRRGYAGS
ncbi:hypothetical protein BJ684DRAFT_16583 [Piptocephalis cylindrospora]|uniref:RRM domain-containing protein n=1 Tax=Piptocephalis cylindrospora TaxID=1907219 RepID=A0A4V1IY15_9FUNG|nr:hypothetical protein BJ684DRAFT_16583 [Piptocephalis cylindrospora]|eukprot:RKP12979.1 hypothetical protein BJ684DRAFT_16583 [Piptocephalis cylindrospora]